MSLEEGSPKIGPRAVINEKWAKNNYSNPLSTSLNMKAFKTQVKENYDSEETV